MLATNAKNKDDLTYYQKHLVIGRIFSIITREINSTDLVNIAAINGNQGNYYKIFKKWLPKDDPLE